MLAAEGRGKAISQCELVRLHQQDGSPERVVLAPRMYYDIREELVLTHSAQLRQGLS